MRQVTVVGYRRALGTSITLPVEMLNAADLIARIAAQGQEPLQLTLASLDGRDIALTGGLTLACRTQLFDIEACDLVILPALWGNPAGVVRGATDLADWLRHQHEAQTAICAVGTASYFLAEAGLLDHKMATTHWYYFDHFAARYPSVRLQRERFITRAGNLYCAGSVNSVRDVMLYFIEDWHGPEVAHQVSRHFTHEVQRNYGAALLLNAPQQFHDDESIIEVQAWIHAHYQEDLRLDALAQRFGLSVRSLSRHFKRATGKSPMQYLQQVRIDNAKELLKATNLGVAEIAWRVGYPDSTYFSALFRRLISLSPTAYRRLVRKKLFRVPT